MKKILFGITTIGLLFAIGTGVYAYRSHIDPRFPSSIEMTKVADWTFGGTITRDGQAMSWAMGEKTAQLGIVIPTLELEQLKLSINGQDVTDLFSPDGTKLLFRGKSDGRLYWFDQDLGGLVRVSRGESDKPAPNSK